MNYDMNIHSNPNAQAWAKFFIQTKEEKSWRIEDIDESLMIGWFANAMMAMHDHIESQRTWVGLTDEEKLVANQMWRVMDADGFIQAIEAKLKDKNL